MSSTTEKKDSVLSELQNVTAASESSTTSKTEAAASATVKPSKGPGPLQIVSIGTEEDKFAFTFHEDKLNSIMSQIPVGWKVAVISVVGAFRTGKSFLLSWFLTYLHCLPKVEDGPGALMEEGGTKKNAEKWFESVETIKQDGFHWQAGSERDTTGIWMWSQPFYRGAASGEPTAILLVDSQGMFDNETTMKLTSSIFGLSTLLSSYQIYNVDKRIQEDNLQQLALFSEYARSADIGSATDENIQKTAADKPFQTMEFLVRDWQHFEDEEDYDQMEQEMAEYLEKVISEREAKDLQETREQIQSCFEKITCYGLTHPGMAVIKKNFQGEVSKMDETFLNLLDRYCRRVFSTDNLKPKVIHGRELSAAELGSYIKAYAGMFSTGASFPEASTMLEATTSAHYTNAVNTAVSLYNNEMDRISGANCSNYVMPKVLQDEHRHKMTKSLEAFKSMATFGSKRVVDDARQSIIDRINDDFEKFSAMNEGRNPLKGAGTTALPLAIAFVAYILQWIADLTCSPYSEYCRNASDNFSHVFWIAVFFLLLVSATQFKQTKDWYMRMWAVLQPMVNAALANGGGKAKKD